MQDLKTTQSIERDTLYLDGTWNFTKEYAENRSAVAKIIFKYTGKSVYFVTGSKQGVVLTIFRDGKAVEDLPFAGSDVILSRDGDGRVRVKEERLYQLIEDSEYGEHILEIIIETPGLQAFTFTFG